MSVNGVYGGGRGRGYSAPLARWLERVAPGSGRPSGRRTSSRAVVPGLVAAILLAASVLMVPTEAQAAPGDLGSEGPSHAGTGTPTGTKRAESVLWFNDGYWWGNLWDTGTSDFHIFRFEAATNGWVDTGVATEPRANTHHDVLWDGTTLYVASHLFVNDGVPAASGFPSTLRRYSYNTGTNTYTLLGSSQINNYKTETLSVDKDTTGRLWATWQQDDRIYLNNTGTDGTTWGTPFPIAGGDVSLDDTSALIALAPGRMGLMWSKQSAATAPSDGFYWSIHTDGAGTTSWSVPKGITTGAKTGDDHMNLKWLDSSGGRVFAAVKTSFTSSAQPLIMLLAMDSAGVWTKTTIATVSECPNRVIVLIDEAAQRLRTFATYPKPSGTTNAGACSSSGGAIYEKSTPLNNINFTTAKTLRILDADQYVHNASSTKQNLNNARTDGASTTNSGLMVIADVGSTSSYWYHFESGGTTPPPDTTPPDTTITAGPSGTVTSTTAQFSFTSTEAGTFECSLDAAAYAACTSPVTYTGLSAGSHTFSVRATDAAGNTDATPATRTWTIDTPDTTPPDTTITAGPSGTVTSTTAQFSFISTEAGTFECSLDAAAYAACTSPVTYTGLSAGSHTFSVRATDAAGNTDATPATRTWTIDTTQAGGVVRSSFSTAVNTTAATTLRIAKPSGVVAGDVLVSCVSLNGGSIGAAGVPAGWTLLASQTSLANPKVYGYYKVATSAEPVDYSWTTSSVVSGGVIARYSGASGLDTTATAASGAAAASGTVGQVTTTSNAMLVGCMSVNSSSVTLSSPAGMTQVVETGDRRFELADGLQPTAGPSGTKTWTFSAAREWAGWLVALRSR